MLKSSILKRMSALVLAFMMMCFTGCKDEAKKNTDNNDSSTLTEANRPYSDDEIDLGGKDITVLVLGGSGVQYPDPKSEDYEAICERVEYVEETYNCNIVFDATYGYPEIHEQIVANALSGLNLADIMYSLPWNTVSPYITQKIAVTLDDYLDFENENLKDRTLNDWGYYLGKHYIFTTGSTGVNCALLYNKDIFERDNLEDPFELQQKGEWTWDKFLEIAKAATKRDASGKVQQWGVVTTSGADFMMQLLASNNAEALLYENDQFKVNFSDKKVMEVFDFLNKIVVQDKCGILTELVLEVPERGDKAWKNGTAAMAFSSLSVAKTYAPENCGFIICPKGPSATDYAAPAHSGPAYMVSCTSKEPEASARIMYDLFARWDTSIPGAYSEDEMEQFLTGSGDYDQAFCENDFETFKLYRTHQNTDVMRVVLFNDIQNYLINCIYAPNVYLNIPLSTVIDQWTPVAEDYLSGVNSSLAKK